MPVELSELLNNERWIDVEVMGVTLRVAYRPTATSLKRQAQVQKRMRELSQADIDEEAQVKEAAALFCEMISDWDLTERGAPLPISPDVVAGRLPGIVVNTIMHAVGEDAQQQQQEKKVSSATSGVGLPPGGKRASVPNGTTPSEPRGTWA